MRADAHVHLFSRGFAGADGAALSAEPELGLYDALRMRHGIERALVVGYEGEARYRGNNDELARLAKKPWVNPLAYLHDPPTARLVCACLDRGFVGFSLYPALSPDIAAWPDESIDALNASAAILSINADPPTLIRMAELLRRLDRMQILLSHLGLPGPVSKVSQEHLSGLLNLANAPHIYVKLSGLYAIDPPYPHEAARPVVESIADAFGADRLLWGSDFAPVLAYVDTGQLFVIPDWCRQLFSATEQDAVYGGTLIRILDRG